METERPKFCEECGARLLWTAPEAIGFNKHNGKRRYYFELHCPARKWYQILHAEPKQRIGYEFSRPWYKVEEV